MQTKQLFFSFIFSLLLTPILLAWGPTGHRVVGELAQKNLKKRAQKKIDKLLNGDGLALVSTYGDEIKSDRAFDSFYTWHYVNFADGVPYNPKKRNPKGDLIYGIDFCMNSIQDEKTAESDKVFYLKFLVHLVGDLHQPLHTGHAEDKGGNDIKVTWFREKSNLHRVWDENLISYFGMSYTEICANLPKISRKEKKEIQAGSIMDWVAESRVHAKTIYASAKNDDKLGYRYTYDYMPLMKEQLQKGGLRLAALLNNLFA